MKSNYTKTQLQDALNHFEEFIKMIISKGVPIRLEIARDLIKKELE